MLRPISSLGVRILRQLPAESAHQLTLALLPWAERLGLLPGQAVCGVTGEVTSEAFYWQGLCFGNRVGLAAGFDKNADAVDALAACGFGFVEIGTLTPRPQPGNPAPRLFRLPQQGAIINRMGFNNKGVDHAVRRLHTSSSGIVKGINIGKNADTPIEQATDDYLYCMRRVYPYADYLVANISSPNTRNLRSLQHGEVRNRLFAALAGERERLAGEFDKRVPILIKIAPDIQAQAIPELVEKIVANGLDGVIAANTTTHRPKSLAGLKHAGESGGLSGEPLKPFALATVAEVARCLPRDKLLIGAGGISSQEDAQAFFAAGANLVQLYTSLVYQGPGLVEKIRKIGPGV